MLAPKVIYLPPPKSQDIVINEDDKIHDHLNKQYFNHSISLTLPYTLELPKEIEEVLNIDTDYYHLENLPAYELVNQQFVNLFVRTGQLTLHSVDTRLDQDNCLAINPEGVLTLLLRKDVFHSLGLEGKMSEYANDRFLVTLDLKSSTFSSDSKTHSRTLERLKAVEDLKFNVILAWDPPSDEFCPSSVAAWFEGAGFKVRSCSNKITQLLTHNQAIPDDESAEIEELIEWVAMLHLGCDLEPKIEEISSYQAPWPKPMRGPVLTLHWTGFFTSARICQAVKQIKDWVVNKTLNVWVSVSIHGMDDSVTTFGDMEHHFYVEGDYNTNIIIARETPLKALIHTSSSRAPRGRKRRAE